MQGEMTDVEIMDQAMNFLQTQSNSSLRTLPGGMPQLTAESKQDCYVIHIWWKLRIGALLVVQEKPPQGGSSYRTAHPQ